MEKGWEQIVAVIGILLSGAAYLPIDPLLPRERIWLLLEDAGVDLILTQPCIEEVVDWPERPSRLSVRRPSMTVGTSPLPKPNIDQHHLAYIIYTSGSTGRPKGVMIDHAAAHNTIVDINRKFSVTPDDRIFALSALSFDLSVYDIFGTLAAGATIVLPDPGGVGDPSHWFDIMREKRVTLWNSAPALMELLVDYLDSTVDRPVSPLRLVLLSGDWIAVSLPDRIKKAYRDVSVVSLGGATEASIWSIFFPIETVSPDWKSIPYGKALANQSVCVRNAYLEPCPVWVTGEICIGGDGLAQGYWRDDAQTAKAFQRHPRTGERLYRTGDLGRLLPDGNIEILGREDHQVKIRGHRIELKEIEAALGEHPSVIDTVVTVDTHGDNKRLLAYVVPRRIHSPAIDTTSFAQAELRLRRPGLRNLDGQGETVPLPAIDIATALAQYREAASCRAFTKDVLAFDEFAGFLYCLAALSDERHPFPRFLYPSAGGLYAVQTYIGVREGRIAGLKAGTYYYNPYKNELVRLVDDDFIAGDRHARHNNPLVQDAAFFIVLVGRTRVIEPVYPGNSEQFCLLEAGHMGQLLMRSAHDNGLGLCAIGQADYSDMKAALKLEPHDKCLYGFVGARPFEEASHSKSTDIENLPETLREFLQQKLPAYMVPSALTVLDKMPLNENGKLDRRALPAPDSANEQSDPSVDATIRIPAEVKQLVRDVIDTDVPDHDVNLMHLGATSLDLIRIVNAMEQRFGRRPLSRPFFHNPMLSSLMAVAAAHVTPDDHNLVLLQESGMRLPLICVHDNSGHILPYRNLARRFKPHRPVYGLEYTEALAATSIEALAAKYVSDIQRILPDGPYAIAGYSLGAIVAYEIARQLSAAGHKVALLALLDGGPPNYPPTGLNELKSRIFDLLAQPVADYPQYLFDRVLKGVVRRLRRLLARLGILRGNPLHGVGPHVGGDLPSNPHLIRLHGNYAPGPYNGPVEIFRCTGESHFWRLMPDLGWGASATGDIKIHEVVGKHGTMLEEPTVEGLAAQLDRLMNSREERRSVVSEGIS